MPGAPRPEDVLVPGSGNAPVPTIDAQGEWMQKTGLPYVMQYHRALADKMGYPEYTPTTNYRMVVKSLADYDGAIGIVTVDGSGTELALDPSVLGDYEEVLFHELVHVVQNYTEGNGARPSWFIEGMADLAKNYWRPGAKGLPAPSPSEHYKETMYAPAAYLLQYIEINYGPNIVRDMNVAGVKGTSIDSFIMERTGKTFDQLWEDMRNGVCVTAQKSGYVDDDVPDCYVKHTMGGVICPILYTLADASDTAFAFLSDNFLVMKPQLVQGDATRDAWEKFRDLANVIFVIGFLIIVYSQITSAGLSNYGIKRLLPKLIVVAILVNTSYFVCQLAVDISNYLGYALAQFFGQALLPRVEDGQLVNNPQVNGAVGVLVAAVLAAGLILYLTVSMSVLVPAVFALVMVVIILIARQALIVLLIVVSPIAFAAYLLPNTERFLKSWWKMFYSLLMVFPIVGLIFGASKLVSFLLMPEMPEEGVDLPDDFNYTMAFIAIGAATLPFLAVPSVLKGSLKATGAIGAKLEGAADKASGAAKSGAAKNVKNRYEGSRMAKIREIRKKEKALRSAQILGGTYQGKNKIHRARSRMYSAINSSDRTGAIGDRIASEGASATRQEEMEAVKQARARLSAANLNDEQRMALIKGESVKGVNGNTISGKGADALAIRQAAREGVLDGGDADNINALIDQAGSLSVADGTQQKELTHLADSLESSKNKPKWVQPGDTVAMRQHTKSTPMKTSSEMMTQALHDNVYGQEAQVTTGRNEMGVMRNHIDKLQKATGYSSSKEKTSVDKFISNAQAVVADERLLNRAGKQKRMIERSAVNDFDPKGK